MLYGTIRFLLQSLAQMRMSEREDPCEEHDHEEVTSFAERSLGHSKYDCPSLNRMLEVVA
jgi:hypothetical protein